ncbi:flagellar assembly protein FliH [Accumulibacter sp.]|uniref:flagellar assembly protein FliH n=1 Tax=Accumulibacter sp. TaxID=2053492 RepID=UPI0025E7237A|nr:flagellar assembly protein FliH [Accumulibacter sp.]MCM8612913.1 flagellar assembly protein FliH [Accumulibacter sp.]MCM8636628.1 flagellar assembly protein FliH [Accumulibacter sp.]MCM8639422.1 flagellar assembly protein FliH [Accumulibacter sp.]
MSDGKPRDRVTAYQRWQVAVFDRPASGTPAAAQTESAPPPQPPAVAAPEAVEQTDAAAEAAEAAVARPTDEDLERIIAEARAAGYAAGQAEGLDDARAEAAKLAVVLDNLQQAVAGIEQEIADHLLALAIEIANQVMRQSLRLQPELILPLVREAMTALHPHQGQPQLFLHPDDAALVRARLGEQLAHGNWRISDDSTLTAGGCRVEVGASEVDATVETRWRRVIEAIGANPEWLREQA